MHHENDDSHMRGRDRSVEKPHKKHKKDHSDKVKGRKSDQGRDKVRKSSKHKKDKSKKVKDNKKEKKPHHKKHRKSSSSSRRHHSESESESSTSSSGGSDSSSGDEDAPRSIITGKKIKMKLDQTPHDKYLEAERAIKRHFMNSQY